MNRMAVVLLSGLVSSIAWAECPPPPDHRSAVGGWELFGSPLGTPIAVASTTNNTSLAAYYVTLDTTYSNADYGVVVEEVRHGATIGKELVDCYWRDHGDPKPWIDLALDSAGNPSVVYQNEIGDMVYAQRNTNTAAWDKELILPQATNENWRGLAFDSTGRAAVVFWDSAASNPMYWRRDAANAWSVQPILLGADLRSDVAVARIPSGGFEIYGRANSTNQLRIFTRSASNWVEQTVSAGTNEIAGLSVPRVVSGAERFLFYLDGLSLFHALHQSSPSGLWEDCSAIATGGASGISAAQMVGGSLVASYYNGGANVMAFTPANSNLATWMVATNWAYGVSWHSCGSDAAILDEGCGNVGVFFRTVDGNNKIGNNYSEIQWVFAGPASGPQPNLPHAVDWTWAYHDDDDGIDDRQTEQVPGTDFTFIPSQPIVANQGFRIYFLANDNFAGDNNGNAWVRWWNGEGETWFPTFRISTFDIGSLNFHGQGVECYSLASVWASDIWGSSTRPGTNYYAIQLTSPSHSPADWDYLLRTDPLTTGSGSNNVNQAIGEEADYSGHDWPIFIGLDIDADGMEDDWETTHFGSVTNGAPDVDSDLDGNDNLAEFRLGTHPKDPNSKLSVWWTEIPSQLGWSTVEKRRYRVQSSPNLRDGPWQDLTGSSISETNEAPVGTESESISSTATSLFYRVRLAP